MPRHASRPLLACLLACAAIGALVAAFAWFEARYLRTFDDRTAFFSGAELRLPEALAGPGPVRLVHFWDPACPCNVGNQQHLTELVERFASHGVAFYAVARPGSGARLPEALDALSPLDELPGSAAIPASPAVAIWDTQGRLAYFGPYSEGLLCNASNSFIEPILEALSQGRPVRAGNSMAVGCFCPWGE